MTRTTTSARTETTFNWMGLTPVATMRATPKPATRVRAQIPSPSAMADALFRSDSFDFTSFG